MLRAAQDILPLRPLGVLREIFPYQRCGSREPRQYGRQDDVRIRPADHDHIRMAEPRLVPYAICIAATVKLPL